jgi:hypothetical protein
VANEARSLVFTAWKSERDKVAAVKKHQSLLRFHLTICFCKTEVELDRNSDCGDRKLSRNVTIVPTKYNNNNNHNQINLIQSAQKCGSNFYTKCHQMALSKNQICSILKHSIFEFFRKNMLRRFSVQFLPPICALKFVEMLPEGFSYALSIMVVNLNIFNKI